jgi:hypothetical protein
MLTPLPANKRKAKFHVKDEDGANGAPDADEAGETDSGPGEA